MSNGPKKKMLTFAELQFRTLISLVTEYKTYVRMFSINGNGQKVLISDYYGLDNLRKYTRQNNLKDKVNNRVSEKTRSAVLLLLHLPIQFPQISCSLMYVDLKKKQQLPVVTDHVSENNLCQFYYITIYDSLIWKLNPTVNLIFKFFNEFWKMSMHFILKKRGRVFYFNFQQLPQGQILKWSKQQ